MKTPEQLKGQLRNMAKDKGVSAQELLQIYMFERLIERLSLSNYRSNLVLKGGLLIASLIGIDERSTMDMDTTIVGVAVNEESVIAIIEEIISINLNDEVEFRYSGISEIRKKGEYSNYTITLEAKFGKIIVPLKIDITTGDIITPRKIEYDYYLTFSEKKVIIYSYPIETIISEKLETVLSRNVTNTRARDFYDLYLLYNTKWDTVDLSVLRDALIATATERLTLEEVYDYEDVMLEVAESKIVIASWDRYQTENSYTQDISFSDVLNVINNILIILDIR